MSQPTTTVEATGVLFRPRDDDPADLVDGSGRQPVIDLTRRLRPAARPIDGTKLTPFLGYWGQLRPGQAPEAFVVKVMAISDRTIPPAAARLLANEEEAAKRTGLLLPDVPATGVGDGYAWVIRRYIHGLTLSQVREQGRMRGNRMRLARLLLEHLVGLHARTYNGRPLFHGDIKPANVIVTTSDGEVSGVELIDFESGGASGDEGPAYRHATFQFASPEHFLAPTIGQPSDVFSWGLTVLDMFAPGRHPFVVTLNDPELYRRAYGSGAQADEAVLATIDDDVLRECVRQALTVIADYRPSAGMLLSRLQPAAPRTGPARPIEVPTEIIALPQRPGAPAGASTQDFAAQHRADSPHPAAPHPAAPQQAVGSPALHDPDVTRINPAVRPGPGEGTVPVEGLGPAGGPGPVVRPDHSLPGSAPAPASGHPSAPGAGTRVLGADDVTRPVYVPLAGTDKDEAPQPMAVARGAHPLGAADPDSVPAQVKGWWQQLFGPLGYLGAEEFDVRHWAAYLGVTLLGALVTSLVLAAVLTGLWRVIVP